MSISKYEEIKVLEMQLQNAIDAASQGLIGAHLDKTQLDFILLAMQMAKTSITKGATPDATLEYAQIVYERSIRLLRGAVR